MDKEPINDSRMLPIECLEANEGQLFGLPANPREIAEQKMELLKADIQKYPQFLKYNALKVYPMKDGKYIVIGGNMRYHALQALGYKEVPCVVIPRETHVEELKAYIILDNSSFGKWEWSMLANEWETAQLQEWGVDLTFLGDNDKDWDDLPLVEGNPTEPNLLKPIKIVISVPYGESDVAKEIKEKTVELIKDYSGVEVN